MRTILTTEQLEEGVQRLAQAISHHFRGRTLTIVGVLTGSLILVADLIRRLNLPLRLGVIQASSYKGSTAAGSLVIHSDLLPDIKGRDVLVVDDIFDTGQTLHEVVSLLDELGPHSIRSAVLLRKTGRQKAGTRPDFVGFDIPDVFVVGYGLDYRDMFRNLPYVAALDPEELDCPVE